MLKNFNKKEENIRREYKILIGLGLLIKLIP